MYESPPSHPERDIGSDPLNERNSAADESRRILTLAVEQGLSVLGESVADVVFSNLHRKFSMSKGDVIDEPDRFIDALKIMFGTGAGTVEMLIVRSLCETISADPGTLNPATLSHCLSLAKHKLRIKTE